MFLLFIVLGFLGAKNVLILSALAIAFYLGRYYWRVSKYPKGPFPLPFIGNTFQFTPLQLQYDFEKLRKIYGDVFTVWFFGTPMVVISREEAIREAIVTHGDAFVDRTGEFPEPIFQTIENGGIIFASGDNWREQRRSTLHILRDFGVGKNVMEQQVHEQVEGFVEALKNVENKEAVDLRWPIQVMIANVINQLLYGYSYPHNNSNRLMTYAVAINSVLSELFESIFMLIIQIFPWAIKLPYIGYQAAGRHVEKYQWCLNFVKEDVKNSLQNYSVEEEPNCVAQAYFQRMEKNSELNLENLYNVCADFFMAGMETTATTLRWAVLYLAENQEVQEKMRKEIGSVVGFNRLTSLRDRTDLPYTTAVMTELQRITNIVPLNLQRKSKEEVTIGGKTIPAGTNCVPQIFSCLVDDRYFPEPEKFNPDRFISEDGSLNTELMGHVVPFSMGKRQCAGESLARTELFLVLSTIVQKFELYPQEGKQIDFSPVFGLTLTPKTNLLRIKEVDTSNI